MNKTQFRNTAIVILLILIVLAVVTGTQKKKETSPEALALESMDVTVWNWSMGGAGTVLILDQMSISNNGSKPVKDIELTCTLEGASGTKIDAVQKRIFQIIRSGKKLDVEKFSMGFANSQTAKVQCEVTNLSIAGAFD